MAKKNKVFRKKGVKVVVQLEKKHNRPMVPRGTIIFKSAVDYNRQREKKETRERAREEMQ